MQSNALRGKKQPCSYTGMSFKLAAVDQEVFESCHGQVH